MSGAALKRGALGAAVALALSACASTAPVTNLTSTSATFHARGTYDGSDAHLYFEYSTNRADIGTSTAQRTPTTNLPAQPAGTPGSLDQPVTGLTPNTRYYYDVCGGDAQWNANGGDLCDGNTHSFVTLPANVQPVTIDGPMVTGSVSAGQPAGWSFTGTAGQVVAPLFEDSGFGSILPTVSVQDASGNELTATQGTYTLPAAGTYTVVVDAAGGTGSIDLGVYDNSPVTLTPNGPAIEVPILDGEQTVVSFTGNAGTRISATDVTGAVNYTLSGLPTVSIEDAAGDPLPRTSTESLIGEDVIGPTTLPTTGTYKLVFDSDGSTALLSLNL
jgi:hypothetical protein